MYLPPSVTVHAAALVDSEITRIVEDTMAYSGCLMDPITLRRFRLPARHHGCGMRSRAFLAPVAWSSCLIESAERFLSRGAGPGTIRTTQGIFPMLRRTFGQWAFDSGPHRFCHRFAAFNSWGRTGAELAGCWQQMQQVLGDSAVAGPLHDGSDDAGDMVMGSGRLQHRITVQLETVLHDQLHRDMMQLPVRDTRRVAWVAADRYSTQWVTAWPTARLELTHLEMREVVTTCLGRESPAVRHLVAQTIPCSNTVGGRVCDVYGFELGLAMLPGGDHTTCHDECGGELFALLSEARFRVELQPAQVFSGSVDPQVLAGRLGRPHGIVPDGMIMASLPRVSARMGQPHGRRRGPRQANRSLLVDVKTIHGGSDHYYSPHHRDAQGGAVRHREQSVQGDYERHARALDRRYHSGAPNEPVLERLRWFTPVRGLVFGQYTARSVTTWRTSRSRPRARSPTYTGAWRVRGRRGRCGPTRSAWRVDASAWWRSGPSLVTASHAWRASAATLAPCGSVSVDTARRCVVRCTTRRAGTLETSSSTRADVRRGPWTWRRPEPAACDPAEGSAARRWCRGVEVVSEVSWVVEVCVVMGCVALASGCASGGCV